MYIYIYGSHQISVIWFTPDFVVHHNMFMPSLYVDYLGCYQIVTVSWIKLLCTFIPEKVFLCTLC